MYIWNVKALAKDFAENRVTNKSACGYVLLFFLLTCVLDYVLQSPASKVGIVIYAVIGLVGIFWCYQGNQLVDDRQFVERLLAFGILATGRALILVFLLLPVIYGFGKITHITEPGQEFLSLVTSQLWNSVIYIF